MAKIISLFNHKGDVSKTTTAFNLGWMMARMGKKILLADFDPQCNLTGMVMGFEGVDDLETTYVESPPNDVANRSARRGVGENERKHGEFRGRIQAMR